MHPIITFNIFLAVHYTMGGKFYFYSWEDKLIGEAISMGGAVTLGHHDFRLYTPREKHKRAVTK